jgi:SAM-dependent methyltransferase
MRPDREYWEGVHQSWKGRNQDALWRRHSDAVDIAWMSSWLPRERVHTLLKTDLFNEGIADGLYPALAPFADRVFGMDLSLGTAVEARRRNPGLSTVNADVRWLPFRDGVFDVVISNSTFDHFEAAGDIASSIGEARRVLGPRGHLLIGLDNMANPLVALRNVLPIPVLQRLHLVPYYVGPSFGPRRLCRVLRQCGFEVEATGAIVHCPRWLAVNVCRVVERRLHSATQEKWLRWLRGFEQLSRLPTRYLSGHLVVARARSTVR